MEFPVYVWKITDLLWNFRYTYGIFGDLWKKPRCSWKEIIAAEYLMRTAEDSVPNFINFYI